MEEVVTLLLAEQVLRVKVIMVELETDVLKALAEEEAERVLLAEMGRVRPQLLQVMEVMVL